MKNKNFTKFRIGGVTPSPCERAISRPSLYIFSRAKITELRDIEKRLEKFQISQL